MNMKDIMVVLNFKIFKISVVNLRLARLVLGWATVSARHQPAPKPTQPGHPSLGSRSEYRRELVWWNLYTTSGWGHYCKNFVRSVALAEVCSALLSLSSPIVTR